MLGYQIDINKLISYWYFHNVSYIIMISWIQNVFVFYSGVWYSGVKVMLFYAIFNNISAILWYSAFISWFKYHVYVLYIFSVTK